MDIFEPRWQVREESDEAFEERYRAALEAGKAALDQEIWAQSVGYDADSRMIWLQFKTGMIFGIPVDKVSALAGATDETLQKLALSPSGMALECRPLDVDISVEGLVLDQLGGESWLKAMRRRLNQATAGAKSPKKAIASAENGKKGGRPRKVAGA